MKPFLLTLFLMACTSFIMAQAQNHPTPSGREALITEFKKPVGKCFPVAEVKMADSLLFTNPATDIFENKLDKKIMYCPDEFRPLPLVSCPGNGLIQTIQQCYDNHRPLLLSPDIIWLAICQAVSIHINQHFDSLENIIFIKDKPSQIIIRNDSLELDSRQWKRLIASFSSTTTQYTQGDFYSFFVPQFTTTTPIITTAYQITLLESYKKAFEYIAESGCGIPNITLTGEKKDWQEILARLNTLDKLGLTDWKNTLIPIITEFINVFDNHINTAFWQSIYKSATEYNAFYISGWIIKFFPYIVESANDPVWDEEKQTDKVSLNYKKNPFLDGDMYLLSTLSTADFPLGISKIDVVWNNYLKNETRDLEFCSGFFAIQQYPDKTLEPLIAWTVCDKKAEMPMEVVADNPNLHLKHKEEYWSPHIADSVCQPAIYDIKHFRTSAASLRYIASVLNDSIHARPEFKTLNLAHDSIEFIVLSNGSVENVVLKGIHSDKVLQSFITAQIRHLPAVWFPALAHPTDVLDLWDFPDPENKVKIRVNSKVRIRLSGGL